MNPVFSNLKKENVENVFNEIAKHKHCTVKDISEATGISIVTVGKVTDALRTLRLITRDRSREITLGRRSYVYHQRLDRCVGVFSVCEKSIRFTVIDMNLSVKYDKEECFSPEKSREEVMIMFTDFIRRNLKSIIKRSTCIGEAVLLPCDYDKEADKLDIPIWNPLSYVSINSVFFFGQKDKQIITMDKRIAFIKGIKDECNENDSVFVLFAGKKLSSSHFRGSDNDFFIGECGSIILSNSNTFDFSLLEITEPKILCDRIAEYCISVLNTVKTDKIYITGDRFNQMQSFANFLIEKIYMKCGKMNISVPEIFYRDYNEKSCQGITADIRRCWFKEEIE